MEGEKEMKRYIHTNVDVSKISMPVFLDSEVVQSDRSGRSDKLSKAKRTEMLKVIC